MKHAVSPLTVSTLVLSILGFVFFYGALKFASQAGTEFVLIFAFLIAMIAVSSLLSAYFWETALIKRHKHTHFSLGSTALIALIVFAFLSIVQTGGKPMLLSMYISLGDFLRDNMGINIYYLDYSGFALLYFGTTVIFLSLVLDYLILKYFMPKKSK